MARIRRRLGAVASIGAVGFGAVALARLPSMFGLSWEEVLDVMTGVTPAQWAVLLGVWGAGMLAHTVFSQGALPGIGVRRALTLNLCGSAMATLLPFGGAAGTGLGYAIARGWGVSFERYAAFAVLTHAWSVAGRLLVGLLIVAAGVSVGVGLPHDAGTLFVSVAATFTCLAAAATLLVVHTPRRLVVTTRRSIAEVAATGWRQMTLGVVGFMLLRWLLFWLCLLTVNAGAPFWTGATAFALERIGSLLPVAPSVTGVAELGAIAVMVWLGVPALGATAGAVLYRSVLVAVEVPAGVLLTSAWWCRARRMTTTRSDQQAGAGV